MYVICAGMYRACSTWQYEVVAHLVERHHQGRRLGYLTGEQFADTEGRYPQRGWRVFKSHEEHPHFRRLLATGRALAVYAYRDVRDVVYSLMHKRQLGFDTLLRQGMMHQILANDRFWTSRPGVICQKYEELIAEPAAGVEQLARFLGISPEPGECAAIAAEYSFEANRRRARSLGERLAAAGVDLADPAHVQACDQSTLLHWNHLRDGRVGGWRDRATPRERAILARVLGPWVAVHGYDPDPEASAHPLSRHDRRAILRGAFACRLRCASLRHPTASAWAKRLLGIATDPTEQPAAGHARHISTPHFRGTPAPARSDENVRPS